MLRRVIVLGVSTCLFVGASYLRQSINAQAQTAASNGGCWINVKDGHPVPNSQLLPAGAHFDDPEHTTATITGATRSFGTYVRVPCPPTNASTTPPTQSNILPGGLMLPGKDKGDGTPDKPGTDVKTTDTKPTDTKTPTTPVKDDKPQQADTPKTQTGKTVTGKDEKPSKATAAKDNPKATKHLTDKKTATAHKSVKQAKDKPKEDKTQVHIEFFSTGGRMGGGGLGR
ncbi:MAG TPA: hypothetical protein VIJ78_04195 [Pseudolabrys sp.]